MRFGTADPSSPLVTVSKTPQQEAETLIGRSLDAGINFFDTADVYTNGETEKILGEALGSRRKDVVISTKLGFRSGEALIQAGASYRYVLAAAEGSLRGLRTDYIDLLSIRKFDPRTPAEETARALENLVQRGLVRYPGLFQLDGVAGCEVRGHPEATSRFAAGRGADVLLACGPGYRTRGRAVLP